MYNRHDGIVVFGATGTVGRAVVKALWNIGITPLTPSSDACDFCSVKSIEWWLDDWAPDTIINCVGYTDVIGAEDEENAFNVVMLNVLAPKILAAWANKNGARLIHFSTDYVFDGMHPPMKGYSEYADTNPLNVYGKTKRDGEELIRSILANHVIVRTSSVYGTSGDGKQSFVDRVRHANDAHQTLHIIDDGLMTPTPAFKLAKCLVEDIVFDSDVTGTYHMTPQGACTWYEFAQHIRLVMNLPHVKIEPTKRYDDGVHRPHSTVLHNEALQHLQLDKFKHWKEEFSDWLKE